ncbi:hypothetical protein EW145_g1160 [Phellinidium pouzarii]|uniref:Late embryogenesis abundant protein LEA-2 subgroup domain-containing protein n=1 Tax=Phellinidium pouzarii TaxID=167371 RepID=A0A4S4LFM0_9AGAM|nr:hypothetical protein EW145_g1160 [Phellinidium pouzarii]
MSYSDPYYSSQPAQNFQAHRPYTDAPDYDPYNTHQQHPTYDQSGYADEDYAGATHAGDHVPGATNGREKSTYEDAFPPALRPPESTGAIRLWRKDQRSGLWNKGGRGKCCLRFCCCTLFIAVFLIISIVLTLAVWIRPPDITINQVGLTAANGSTFQVTSDSLNLNLGVNISVDNPNYFSVTFRDIKVNLTYPIDNMGVGGGEKDNVVFHSHTQTTFNFPFTLTYNLADDTNQDVLKDLLNKCGITGTKQDITVDYKITDFVRDDLAII